MPWVRESEPESGTRLRVEAVAPRHADHLNLAARLSPISFSPNPASPSFDLAPGPHSSLLKAPAPASPS